jgi:penicillin-binding protein 1C
MVGVVVALLGWFVVPFALPVPQGLLEDRPQSPVLLDRHGERIVHLALPDSSRASWVGLEEMPADLIASTVAAEDKRFFSHGGVDFLATMRAAADGVRYRRVISGASTITQQLVKVSSPPAGRGPLTKVREALLARRLEMSWSKQEILAAYLNRLDYGNLRVGAAEAARFYFQKPLADLSLAECALLAGLPQAPSRLNPVRHPERALARRAVVLQRLAKLDGQDPQRVALAAAEPLGLRPLREDQPAPWLAGHFAARAPGTYRSTLDLAIQRDVEAIVAEEVAKLHHANLRHAAVVVIDNASGGILALVSSADWQDARGGQINGAFVPRSPGSALKPFTYLLALERDRTPATIIADIPTPFRTEQGLELPGNFDRHYRGPVTLRTALACSLNVPALRELNELGGPAPLHSLLSRLGMTTLGDDPKPHGLGLTLGNAPVRLVELTSAYAALARGGSDLPAFLFPQEPAAAAVSVFSAESAYLVAHILADMAARAPAFQPGGPLDLPFPCAVKTGTSSDYRDNWCVGFTGGFTVGVWAGNFENQPMKGISGTDGAGPIFNRTMMRVHQGQEPAWLERPPGLVEVWVDGRTGKLLANQSSSGGNPHARLELVPLVKLPVSAAAADLDESGRALLDASYAEWFEGPHNRRRNELALRTGHAGARMALRVISPEEGATFLLDPEIPSGSDQLRPVTNLPGTARWYSETLKIDPAYPEPIIHLVPGTHTLTVTDPRDGSRREITFHVKSL